jgi:uncharacterized membrane protein YgcG
MPHAALIFAFFLVFAPISALAQTFPALTGRVVDAANLLKLEERAALETKLKAHEDETSNQVVIATLPSLEGTSIESYANRLFRTWQLGQKEKNNGVLLLVAPNERQVRIEVGYGLEGTLTDALAGLVITRVLTPQFQHGHFADGIDEGVDAILDVLTDKTGKWQRSFERHSDSAAFIVTADGRIFPRLQGQDDTGLVTEQGDFRPYRQRLWFGFDPFFVIVLSIVLVHCFIVFLVVTFGPKRWRLQSSSRSTSTGSSHTNRVAVIAAFPVAAVLRAAAEHQDAGNDGVTGSATAWRYDGRPNHRKMPSDPGAGPFHAAPPGSSDGLSAHILSCDRPILPTFDRPCGGRGGPPEV